MTIYAYKDKNGLVIFNQEKPEDSIPCITLDEWPEFSEDIYYEIDYEHNCLIAHERPKAEIGTDNIGDFFSSIINSI